MSLKLDDLISKKKEVIQILDLSKATANNAEEFKRIMEKVPDFKIKPEKVKAEQVKSQDKPKRWKARRKRSPYGFAEPIPAEMRSLRLEDLCSVPIQWNMLTTLRPKAKIDEEYYSRMPQCVVKGCINRSSRLSKLQTKKVSFHKFPENPELKRSWLRALKMENWEPSASSKVCGSHFDSSCLEYSPFITFLKPNAVPTVLPGDAPLPMGTNTKKLVPTQTTPLTHVQPDLSLKEEILNNSNQTSDNGSKNLVLTQTTPLTHVQPDLSLKEEILNNSNQTSGKIDECPYNGASEAELQSSRRRLKITQLKLRNKRKMRKRLTKKVCNLTNIVEDLREKSLINSDYIDMLNNISKSSLASNVSQKQRSIFDEKLRSFAITLHFLSPRAYNFARDNFSTCLPDTRTISRWYTSTNAQPGFSKEVFDALKEKTKKDGQLYATLMFGSMQIRKHVQWDGHQLIGHVDLGMGNHDETSPLATEVLVFHLVFINSIWKIPVGYFFVNGISGDQTCSLLGHCLNLLREASVNIIAMTCDGAANNITAVKQLGVIFDESGVTNTTVKCEGHTIEFFLDACHVLKLIRNALHDLGVFLDKDGRKIEWKDLRNLHYLQQHKGLRLGNKLSSLHINYNNNKMKVKYAAQLLSRSVADSLRYCKEDDLEGFNDCSGTINFLENFNDIFDILNSHKINDKWLKQAIHKKNRDIILQKMTDIEGYIKGLTGVDGKSVLSGPRKTGFIGILCGIKSTRNLIKRFIDSETLKFIPTYKMSQDHLERVFSYIRGYGGINNNPSACQFMLIWRIILAPKYLHEGSSSSGNAIPVDKINMLGINPLMNGNKDPVEIINSTTSDEWTSDFYMNQPSVDDNISLIIPSITSIVYDIVEYIAGYVARRLIVEIKCENCCKLLLGEKTSLSGSLANIKNRGVLIQPSGDLIRICRRAENIFRQWETHPINFNLEAHILKLSQIIFSECIVFKKDSHFSQEAHLNCLIQAVGKKYFTVRIKNYISNMNNEIKKASLRKK